MYPDDSVLEAVRRGLRGRVRTVLLHLGEWATIPEIMREMGGMYWNVNTSEELKERFYAALQKEGESIANYSLRLEHLLFSYNMDLKGDTKNSMLGTLS